MSNQRVLLFTWLALGVILWKVFADSLGYGFGLAGVANPKLGGAVDATALIAVALAAGVAMFLWKRRDVHEFCLDTVEETRQVVWPGKKETRDNTVVVIITSALMAVILGGFDLLWAKLTNLILATGV